MVVPLYALLVIAVDVDELVVDEGVLLVVTKAIFPDQESITETTIVGATK